MKDVLRREIHPVPTPQLPWSLMLIFADVESGSPLSLDFQEKPRYGFTAQISLTRSRPSQLRKISRDEDLIKGLSLNRKFLLC